MVLGRIRRAEVRGERKRDWLGWEEQSKGEEGVGGLHSCGELRMGRIGRSGGDFLVLWGWSVQCNTLGLGGCLGAGVVLCLGTWVGA